MNSGPDFNQVSFQPLFILIRPGQALIHTVDPQPINTRPYALITIFPDETGQVIHNLACNYVYGSQRGDNVQGQWSDLCLIDLMGCPGQTVLQKLQLNFLSESANSRAQTLNVRTPELTGQLSTSKNLASFVNSEHVIDEQTNYSNSVQSAARSPLTFPGQTEFEQYMNAFMTGVAAHLCIFCLIRMNQSSIGCPFQPLDVSMPPVPDRAEDYLTQSVGDYLSYYTRMAQAVSRGAGFVKQVGPTWLSLVDHFWQSFAACFNPGSLNDPCSAIHDSIVGYSRHQEEQVQNLQTKFNLIDEQASSYLTNIQKMGLNYSNQVQDIGQSLVIQQQEIAQQSRQTLNKLTDQISNKLIETGQRSLVNIEDKKGATCQTLANFQSDAKLNIQQITDESVAQLQSVYAQSWAQISSTKEQLANDLQQSLQSSCQTLAQRGEDIISSTQEIGDKTVTAVKELHQKKVNQLTNLFERQKQKLIEISGENIEQLGREISSQMTNFTALSTNLEEVGQKYSAELRFIVEQAERNLADQVQIAIVNLVNKQERLINDLDQLCQKICAESLQEGMKTALNKCLDDFTNRVDHIVETTIHCKMTKHFDRQEQEINRALQVANAVQMMEATVANNLSQIQEQAVLAQERERHLQQLTTQIEQLDNNMSRKVNGLNSEINEMVNLRQKLQASLEELTREQIKQNNQLIKLDQQSAEMTNRYCKLQEEQKQIMTVMKDQQRGQSNTDLQLQQRSHLLENRMNKLETDLSQTLVTLNHLLAITPHKNGYYKQLPQQLRSSLVIERDNGTTPTLNSIGFVNEPVFSEEPIGHLIKNDQPINNHNKSPPITYDSDKITEMDNTQMRAFTPVKQLGQDALIKVQPNNWSL